MKWVMALTALVAIQTLACERPLPPIVALPPSEPLDMRIVIAAGISPLADVCIQEWDVIGANAHDVACITVRELRSLVKLHGERRAD